MRSCAWCLGPIREDSRRDTITCSKPCRQARARFVAAVGRGPRDTSAPLRLAYADPPYPGKSNRYYGDHPDYAGEVDHRELIAQLAAGIDGWALSTSASALPYVLSLCPPGVRVAAWIRGDRNAKALGPLNAWEPVIYWGGRRDVDLPRRLDALHLIARARTTDPARVVGAKPAGFARWIFELLGALPQDEFVDLFPGSGGMARAWSVYTGETS